MEGHGRVTLIWEEDLLIVNPLGPLNEEGVVETINELKQTVVSAGLKSWVRLELWEKDTMGSPQVMENACHMFEWCEQHGCNAAAIVVDNFFQASLLKENFSGNFDVFNNTQEALSWLDKYRIT